MRSTVPSALGSAIAALFAFVTFGCFERSLRAVSPCTRSSVAQSLRVQYVDSVDLLFVIDDSGSMEDEQRALRREIPRLVSALASGDRDGDGVRDFRPVRSLQVGVVSTDMGTGAATPGAYGSCRRGNGRDGVLLRADACGGSTPYFTSAPGMDAAGFVESVACATNLGIGGCGLEQQLEAALKAVTPATPVAWTAPGYVPPRFLDPDTGAFVLPGHALGANSGFVREGSVLAVVIVTDEEDCSAADSSIFSGDPSAAARFGSDAQLRCTRFADRSAGVLHAIERYVDGFAGLRPEPGLVVFSVIAGIPEDLVPRAGEHPDFAAILADRRMRYVETGDRNNFLEDACTRIEAGSVVGSADPARRLVETAAGLASRGVSVSLASICAPEYGPAIDGIVAQIADALNGACLPRDLNPDASGRVDCEVFETLPPIGTPGVVTECSRLEGREFVGLVERDGITRQRCRIVQLDRATGLEGRTAGWFYDDASAERAASCGENGQRIAFPDLARPARGSIVEMECLQTLGAGEVDGRVVCDERASACALGMFCEPGEHDRCGTGTSRADGSGIRLVCDPDERVCVAPCSTDADCREGGLPSHACDGRGVCVNPTCR